MLSVMRGGNDDVQLRDSASGEGLTKQPHDTTTTEIHAMIVKNGNKPVRDGGY